jgi:hypothetical protein
MARAERRACRGGGRWSQSSPSNHKLVPESASGKGSDNAHLLGNLDEVHEVLFDLLLRLCFNRLASWLAGSLRQVLVLVEQIGCALLLSAAGRGGCWDWDALLTSLCRRGSGSLGWRGARSPGRRQCRFRCRRWGRVPPWHRGLDPQRISPLAQRTACRTGRTGRCMPVRAAAVRCAAASRAAAPLAHVPCCTVLVA